MVQVNDQALIDFLLEKNLSNACTSLNSSQAGYWDAYRLSFASGGRISVHPILHMPRIDQFRRALEAAERCAIITRHPEETASQFDKQGIEYAANEFGELTVIWDFDKQDVDELGLIDYRRNLKESP